MESKTIGIVGLGLIGGSFAKAYQEAGWEVLACNRTASVLEFARISGAVDGALTEENVSSCDLVLVTIYPEAAIEWVSRMAPHFGKKPVVIDCCGTKRKVCEALFPVAKKHGFSFIGGHPMAGTQYSGFKYARANLYHNAPMVLVPADADDVKLLGKAEELLKPAGFGSFAFTTPQKHDEMIAFTSQMAHVVSNAYIKSETAASHKGFSAGSYKDMTRVAWLNPDMWAELFLENRDCLLKEIDSFLGSMQEYRDALEAGDRDELVRLLDEGRRKKAEVDGR